MITRSTILALLVSVSPSTPVAAQQTKSANEAKVERINVDAASLYARVVGQGEPAIVLHGGPDFDHAYLLPELDAYRDLFTLIYYDQRGRGLSADNVRAEDVTLLSDLADLDAVRRHYGLNKVLLLGHSWGTTLALEYAVRHPDRVAGLILMNPAPNSTNDLTAMRAWYLQKIGSEMARQREIAGSPAYKEGDPDAVTARYRIHFRPALRREADYENLMAKMAGAFRSQGKAGIIKARAVEDRLMADTWARADYDLYPQLRSLNIPTLVIAGDHDFIPLEVAQRIAATMPRAQLVTIKECGHFGYLECPGEVRKALIEFLRAR